uniref:Uncharacterized protein n=1 Tax=Solanum tuberosum TaxID=4113 RepID=M1DGY4_SOLTU
MSLARKRPRMGIVYPFSKGVS